jgi:hypothetical protein
MHEILTWAKDERRERIEFNLQKMWMNTIPSAQKSSVIQLDYQIPAISFTHLGIDYREFNQKPNPDPQQAQQPQIST